MPVAPTSSRISCPKCGGLNPELAVYCNRCAAPLSTRSAPVAAATEPVKPIATPPIPPTPEVKPADVSTSRGRKICPGCHRFNPAAAAFCAECGVSLPLASSVPVFGGPAGFWIRTGAFVIDGLLLIGLTMFVNDRLGFPTVDYERLPLATALLRDLPALAVSAAITCLYAMILIGTWGGTVGKLMLGLRIVRHSDGGKVPYGLALGRSLAEYMSIVPAGLGYVWIALSPNKRGWHDYLCDTRVVYARAD